MSSTANTSPAPTSGDALEITSLATGVLVGLAFIWCLFSHQVVIRCKYITEGSTACLLGLICGALLLLFRHDVKRGLVNHLLVFDSASFFTYLLPPVIFHAGLSAQRQLFLTHLPSILTFGIIGTILCFVIMTLALMLLAGLRILSIQTTDILALAAIFSATDSVAALQVMDAQTMPLLFSLVFGEGIVNDATSVVLLGAVRGSASGTSSSSNPAWQLPLSFMYLFTCSTVAGVACGAATSLIMRWWSCQGAHQEVAVLGLASYACYLGADALGLSGILALFCAALMSAHWVMPVLSVPGREAARTIFMTMSYLAEGLIFIYVGMDALDPIKWKWSITGSVIGYVVILSFLLLASRAVMVLALSLLHNSCGRERLSSRDMVVMWWSGSMRGAVSVAMAYYYFDIQRTIGDSGGSLEREQHATLVAATLVVVLLSVVVGGAATKPLMALMLQEDGTPIKELVNPLRWRWIGNLRLFYARYRPLPDKDAFLMTPLTRNGEEGSSPPHPSTPPFPTTPRVGSHHSESGLWVEGQGEAHAMEAGLKPGEVSSPSLTIVSPRISNVKI